MENIWHDLLAWVRAEFQQIYIFTLLAIMLLTILKLISSGEFELKVEVETLLNTAVGGILTMMTVIVNSIFSKSKDRQAQRSSDTSAPQNATTAAPAGATS